MNKSTKLTDTLDSATIVKKYLKAIKATDWKAATAIAKLFPYYLTKPKWVKEEQESEEIEQLVIHHCPFSNECTYCQKAYEAKYKKEAEERAKRELANNEQV